MLRQDKFTRRCPYRGAALRVQIYRGHQIFNHVNTTSFVVMAQEEAEPAAFRGAR